MRYHQDMGLRYWLLSKGFNLIEIWCRRVRLLQCSLARGKRIMGDDFNSDSL